MSVYLKVTALKLYKYMEKKAGSFKMKNTRMQNISNYFGQKTQEYQVFIVKNL